jgi:hypothetical protein
MIKLHNFIKLTAVFLQSLESDLECERIGFGNSNCSSSGTDEKGGVCTIVAVNEDRVSILGLSHVLFGQTFRSLWSVSRD